MRKLTIIPLFLVFLVVPFLWVFADTSSGFIPGQIWYSKVPLVEGETVNIHTAVWNGEKDSISAKIEFYDKNVILGSREVLVAPSELKDIFIPWKITSGDHVISAKIISSLISVSGKKEKIILERISTSDDRQYVKVITKNELGDIVSGDKALESQIEKTSAEMKSIIPEKISTPIIETFSLVDGFRDKTYTQLTSAKNNTKNEIDLMQDSISIKSGNPINTEVSQEDSLKKPIAYIKLFLLTALSFIFSNKIAFYGLSILIIFIIIRFIFNKIRNR